MQETQVFTPARPQGVAQPVLAAALTNAVVLIAAQQASLESVSAYNGAAAAPVYIQVFDAANVAAVTLGTTKPKYIFPMGQASPLNLAQLNLNFANGICVAATTTATGNSAPGTAPDAAFGVR